MPKIKVMKKKVLLAVLLQVLIAAHAVAHDFEVNGICYRVLSVDEKTAEVVCKGEMDLNTPPKNYSHDVVIPATVDYNNVTFKVVQVGEYAFYHCDELEHVTFPEGLQEICTSAFQECEKLEDVTFPTSLTNIHDRAFASCTQLKNVVIPANIRYMGDYAFEHCDGVETVRLDDSANRLQEGYWGFAFGFPNARSVYLGRNSGGWAKTWDDVDYWCGNGKLEKVEFGPLVTETPWHFLYGECPNLKTLTIGRNIKTIAPGSFARCVNVKGIEIPASVETIDAEAFSGGFWEKEMALEEIIIGGKVSTIGDNAFKNCKNLKRICVKNQIPASLPENAFEAMTYLNATLYVPTDTKETYSNTKYWSNFQNVEEGEIILGIAAPLQDKDADISGVYLPNGQKRDGICRGLNIIRMSNGTTRKVVVR